MGPLHNGRHERFAQEIAKGKSATEAMAVAGYSDARNSTRLTKNDEIAHRVAELKSGAAERAEITLADVTEHLKRTALRPRESEPHPSRGVRPSALHGGGPSGGECP